MRSKSVEKWIHEHTSGRLREPLAYVAKVQVCFVRMFKIHYDLPGNNNISLIEKSTLEILKVNHV